MFPSFSSPTFSDCNGITKTVRPMAGGCLGVRPLLICALAMSSAAVLTRARAADPSGTDLVRLVDGEAIRGSVVATEADGSLLVAVQRSWLHKRIPRLARQAESRESRDSVEAWKDVVRRLDVRLEAGLQPGLLRAFLERERQRIGERLEQVPQHDLPDDERQRVPAVEPFQFIWVHLPRRMIEGVVAADPSARRMVQWGWHERFDDVERQTTAQLTRRLEAAGVDLASDPPTLGDRLPPLPQSDEEWRKRMALVEDLYEGSTSFEGADGALIRSGDGDGLAALLPLVKNLISAELTDRIDAAPQRPADDWLATAEEACAEEGRFRARRIRRSDGRVATVESVFAVRTGDGEWTSLWRSTLDADPALARPGDVARVSDDPRVRGLIDLVRATGLADAGMLESAIRSGAATLVANGTLEERFATFRATFTDRLDGPPLLGR